MNKKYKIAYFGRDVQTARLIDQDERFEFVAVHLIEDFYKKQSLNPANILFQLIYFLRHKGKYRSLELLCTAIWKYVKTFSSSLYSKYADYLLLVSTKNIPILDLQKKEEVVAFLKNHEVDLIILNVSPLLPVDIINAAKYKAINLHPAPLPQYRGSLPTLWSLKNKDKESALTYFVVNDGIDDGEIIDQHYFSIDNTDNAITMEKKIESLTQETFSQTIINYLTAKTTPKKQDHSKATKTAKYFEYMQIRWEEESVQDIINKILLYPYLKPLHFCYFYVNKKKIYIKKAHALAENSLALKPGEFAVNRLSLTVGAQDGNITVPLFKGIGMMHGIMFLFINKKRVFEKYLALLRIRNVIQAIQQKNN